MDGAEGGMAQAAGGTLSQVARVTTPSLPPPRKKIKNKKPPKYEKNGKQIKEMKGRQRSGAASGHSISQANKIKMAAAPVSAGRRASAPVLADSAVTDTDLGSRH